MRKGLNVQDDPAYKDCPSAKLPNLKDARIDNDNLQLIELIGYGSWATVYKAKCIKKESKYNNDRFYAVKCMIPRRCSAWQQKAVADEIRLHKRCAAASSSVLKIVNVIDEDETTGFLYIVTEYCEGGDLSGFIEKQLREKTPKDNRRICKMFIDILDAVEACHQKGVFHRDLKPENILLRKEGTKVVLADFGLATANRATRDFGTGSEPYMAPGTHLRSNYSFRLLTIHTELLMRYPHSRQISSSRTDTWALGIILINLITGYLPWEKASYSNRNFNWYANKNRDILLDILKDISPEVNEILKDVFRCNPANRISLREFRYRVLHVHSFTRMPELANRFRNYQLRPGRHLMNPARAAVPEPPGLVAGCESSDSESDGPETPEMNAVDDAAIPMPEGVDDLDLGRRSSAAAPEPKGFRIVRVTTKEGISESLFS